jgi:peptidoglycan/LPS O-acetylase OafA/YrhL
MNGGEPKAFGVLADGRRISALTGLRGIAAVWVVLYHLTGGGFAIIDQGYLGFDVFFSDLQGSIRR